MKMTSKRDIFYIGAGVLLSSAAYAFFIVPGKLIPGGVSGISIILHHLFRTPFGIVLLAINLPLLFVAMKQFGGIFGVRTIISVALISVITDLFSYYLKFLVFDKNLLLASVYGGVLLGLGLGLIFRGKGSTGGSDIVGRIMNKYTQLSVGYSIMLVDSFIIIGSGLIFRNYELILFSFITLFLSSKVIDIILEGQDYARGVTIFTTKPELISERIMSDIQRGVSGMKVRGMYTGEEKDMLYCVVSRREISRVTHIVRETDPEAFMVVQNVYEVMGKGFPRR